MPIVFFHLVDYHKCQNFLKLNNCNTEVRLYFVFEIILIFNLRESVNYRPSVTLSSRPNINSRSVHVKTSPLLLL